MTVCAGKTRAGGKCQRPAGWGTPTPGIGRCKLHGGATASHQRKAKREIARQECVRLGLELDAEIGHVDPRDVLEEELWRARCNVATLEWLVGRLPLAEGGIYGRIYHATGEPTGEARPHVLVTMYNEERRHLTAVAVSAAKAGVEERRVAVAERIGQQIAEVIRGVLADLGVSDRGQEVAHSVRRHLALVAGA